MAKQLTAPGCIYTIVARVDTAIYSPDQKWILNVPAGQHDFIAETNEIIIPVDAMMCRKTNRVGKDMAMVTLFGKGAGSLAALVDRIIEQIVGNGNAKVEYGNGKVTVALASSVTDAQIATVENMLARLLPKDVTAEFDPFWFDFTQVEFLESTGAQYIKTGLYLSSDSEVSVTCEINGTAGVNSGAVFGSQNEATVQDRAGWSEYTAGARGWVFWGAVSADVVVPAEAPLLTNRHTVTLNRDGLRLNGETLVSLSHVANFATSAECWLFGRNRVGSSVGAYHGKIYSFECKQEGRRVRHFLPCVSASGVPCMYDTVSKQPFYNAETTGADFIVGMNMKQALSLANLPVTIGRLTVSLPWEAEWDARVQNALKIASTKGWTITVQYRDPEAVAKENISVDYLESTGTQWLSLPEVEINNTDTVKCTLAILDYIDASANGYFAIRGYDAGNKLRMYSTRTVSGGKRAIGVQFGNYGVSKFALKDKEIGEMSISERGWEANGELYAYTSGEASEFSYKNLLLFNQYVLSQYWPSKMRLYKFEVSGKTKLKPALSALGIPCMHDSVSDQNFYNVGTGSFIIGFKTVAQARKLATLPDVTAETDEAKKSLTVSLPWDAQFAITGVPAAIKIALARGWTIFPQYRDPEATTENIEADFLRSEGGAFIDTGIVPTNETGLSLTALPTSGTDTIPFGSRNSNSTRSRFYAVRPCRLYQGLANRIVANGYGWGDWYLIGEHADTSNAAAFIKKEATYLNWFNNRKAISEYGENELETLPFTPECSMYLFAANIDNTAQLPYIGHIWKAAVSVGTQLKANFIPILDSAGIPCMHDTVSSQNFYNANTAVPLIVGFDTTDKAAMSLSKLPVTTAGTSLHISLPSDARNTATLVPAAIDIAETRGWTIFPQYRD